MVVYPDGYEGHFNDCRRVASFSARALNVDDVGFVRRITEQLVEEEQVDPERVYTIGFSNGGHMALRLRAPGRWRRCPALPCASRTGVHPRRMSVSSRLKAEVTLLHRAPIAFRAFSAPHCRATPCWSPRGDCSRHMQPGKALRGTVLTLQARALPERQRSAS